MHLKFILFKECIEIEDIKQNIWVIILTFMYSEITRNPSFYFWLKVSPLKHVGITILKLIKGCLHFDKLTYNL